MGKCSIAHTETVKKTYLNRQRGRCICKGGKPTADLTLSSTMITKQKQQKQQADISAKASIKNKQNKNNLLSRSRITLGIKKLIYIECICPTIPVNHFVPSPLQYSISLKLVYSLIMIMCIKTILLIKKGLLGLFVCFYESSFGVS